MRDLKVALVTGVSSGIGRAVALLLSSRGFHVSGTVRHLSDSDMQTENLELIQLESAMRSRSKCARNRFWTGRTKSMLSLNNAGYTLVGA
jgi:NAD(P)-dependent dehydrogenase (short-subunit alcohol dehydrogenase family)